jgi:peptide/nickel transport system permease protein
MPDELLHDDQADATGSVSPVAGATITAGEPFLARPSEQEFTVQSRSRGRMVLRRFVRHRLAMISLGVFIAIALLAVIGGRLWTYNYAELTNSLGQAPSAAHPFGTDDIGHDLFAQVLRASETSIELALFVALISTVVGSTIGALAGYYGKLLDAALMRFTDLVLVIPVLAILLVLSHQAAKRTGSWFWLGLIIGLVLWTYVARLVRGSFLSLREREFVEAARALGASDGRIILRHLIPNAVGPIIVNTTLTVAVAVLLESALSYLGLGVQPPNTSLGRLIADGQGAAQTEWWLFAFPAIFLVLIVLCINFIGDGLRDAFDPSQTRVRA